MRHTREEITNIIIKSKRENVGHGNYNQVSKTADEIEINGYSCQWIIKRPYVNYSFQMLRSEPTLDIVKKLQTKYAYLHFDSKLYIAHQITGEFRQVNIDSEYLIQLKYNLDTSQRITEPLRRLTISELKTIESNSTHDMKMEEGVDPNNPFAELNTPRRATEKCNLLNPKLPAYDLGDFWIMPNIGNIRPSNQQIIDKVIEIFIRTRNIIADAFISGNFLIYKGEVVCVDVDMALRKGSFCTDNLLAYTANKLGYQTYMKKQKGAIAECVKALTYLQGALAAEDVKNEYVTAELLNLYNMLQEMSLTVTPAIIDLMIKVLEYNKSSGKNAKAQSFYKIAVKQYTSLLMYKIAVEDNATVIQVIKDMKDSPNCVKNINETNTYGSSLLMLAARRGDISVVKALVEAGADIHHVDDDGNSVLYYIVKNTDPDESAEKKIELIEYFLELKVDLITRNVKKQDNILDISFKRNMDIFVFLLKKAVILSPTIQNELVRRFDDGLHQDALELVVRKIPHKLQNLVDSLDKDSKCYNGAQKMLDNLALLTKAGFDECFKCIGDEEYDPNSALADNLRLLKQVKFNFIVSKKPLNENLKRLYKDCKRIQCNCINCVPYIDLIREKISTMTFFEQEDHPLTKLSKAVISVIANLKELCKLKPSRLKAPMSMLSCVSAKSDGVICPETVENTIQPQ
jgi:hypothetical protein